MKTITIPLSKTILEEIEGKTIKKYHINTNGELELKIADCEFWNDLKNLKKEIDSRKGIEIEVDKLDEHFL
ncbi:MAG: hypothetical protein LBM96_05070 [Methanobrevibacter sp.]|jgi:hypothetical protein|nr:hypothetical protein [Candidatus Methanoflexus mossambicus]